MGKIKYFIMDVDGTLTDGNNYMGNQGEVFKAFNIKDGCGIHDLLIPAGICPVIITGRQSEIVLNRCRELGIDMVFQGVSDKTSKMSGFVEDSATVAYIGDDLNDLACMAYVKERGGLIGCPSDAAKQVKEIADFISTKNGGDGAVREFIEYLLIYNECIGREA